MRWFSYDHLKGRQRRVSQMFTELADRLLQELNDDPETIVALRKLLEAKDAAVRSSLTIDTAGPSTLEETRNT